MPRNARRTNRLRTVTITPTAENVLSAEPNVSRYLSTLVERDRAQIQQALGQVVPRKIAQILLVLQDDVILQENVKLDPGLWCEAFGMSLSEARAAVFLAEAAERSAAARRGLDLELDRGRLRAASEAA